MKYFDTIIIALASMKSTSVNAVALFDCDTDGPIDRWQENSSALPVPSVYKFNPQDNRLCKRNFRKTERWYSDAYGGFTRDEAELNDLYSGIFTKMQELGIQLVDNEEFIELAGYSPNPENEEDFLPVFTVGLSDWAQQHFHSSEGASPITTIKQLREALSAMFWHRVDQQLEYAAIMDELMFPEIEFCSEETQIAGWELRSNYYSGVFFEMDLMNMGSYLRNVAEWISRDSRLTVYEFNPSDDKECQKNFRETESWYNDAKEDFQREEAELNDIYSGILSKMQEYMVDLLDNKEFIDWAASSPNPDFSPIEGPDAGLVPELSDWAKQYFYSSEGGSPIKTAQQLKDALSAMYWHRFDWQLEDGAIMGLPMFPDLWSCSRETQKAGWEIQSKHLDGIITNLDLMNMSSFLERVAQCLDSRYE